MKMENGTKIIEKKINNPHIPIRIIPVEISSFTGGDV